MRKLALLALGLFLVILAFAQTQPQNLVVSFDTALDPICTVAVTTDCVNQAKLYDVNNAVIATISASQFQRVGTTSTFEAVIASPRKYGNRDYTATLIAIAFDGSTIESDKSSAVTIRVTPRSPSLSSR